MTWLKQKLVFYDNSIWGKRSTLLLELLFSNREIENENLG